MTICAGGSRAVQQRYLKYWVSFVLLKKLTELNMNELIDNGSTIRIRRLDMHPFFPFSGKAYPAYSSHLKT